MFQLSLRLRHWESLSYRWGLASHPLLSVGCHDTWTQIVILYTPLTGQQTGCPYRRGLMMRGEQGIRTVAPRLSLIPTRYSANCGRCGSPPSPASLCCINIPLYMSLNNLIILVNIHYSGNQSHLILFHTDLLWSLVHPSRHYPV